MFFSEPKLVIDSIRPAEIVQRNGQVESSVLRLNVRNGITGPVAFAQAESCFHLRIDSPGLHQLCDLVFTTSVERVKPSEG